MVINDGDHDEEMNKKALGDETHHSNVIAPSIIRMEHLYYWHDRFKRVTNCNTNNSTKQYEMINLGYEKDPKNFNLELGFTPIERVAFIKLFKEYKDIFSWTYDDLRTYDMRIIQHVISMEMDAKPYQQKFRKMHLKLETLVKKELKKLLDSKIIFLV